MARLDLGDNGLTYLDMREIGKWIERGNLDGLVHLDLSSNTWICTVGATTIATAAARLEHLACLVLRGCDVGEVDDTGDAGSEDVIMGGIFTHPDKGWRQEIVQLATNVLALAQAINALPSIVVFDLSGNKFSVRERDMLKATLTPTAIEATWVKEVRPSCCCCLLRRCPGPYHLAPQEGMHVNVWPAKDCAPAARATPFTESHLRTGARYLCGLGSIRGGLARLRWLRLDIQKRYASLTLRASTVALHDSS